MMIKYIRQIRDRYVVIKYIRHRAVTRQICEDGKLKDSLIPEDYRNRSKSSEANDEENAGAKSVNQKWNKLATVHNESCTACLGFRSKKKVQDWVTAETLKALS